MTQYNSSNVNLSNSKLNKLKSAIKNETELVLRLSSNMIGDNEGKLQFFVIVLQIIHQPILNYQKVNYLR